MSQLLCGAVQLFRTEAKKGDGPCGTIAFFVPAAEWPSNPTAEAQPYGTGFSVVEYFALMTEMISFAMSWCAGADGWTPSSEINSPNV